MATLAGTDKLKEDEEKKLAEIGSQPIASSAPGVVTGSSPAQSQAMVSPTTKGGAMPFASISEYLKGPNSAAVANSVGVVSAPGEEAVKEKARLGGEVSKAQTDLDRAKKQADLGVSTAEKLVKQFTRIPTKDAGGNPIKVSSGQGFELEGTPGRIRDWLNVDEFLQGTVPTPSVNLNVSEQASVGGDYLNQGSGKSYQDLLTDTYKTEQAKSGTGAYSRGEKALDRAFAVQNPLMREAAVDASKKSSELNDYIKQLRESTIPELASRAQAIEAMKANPAFVPLKNFERNYGEPRSGTDVPNESGTVTVKKNKAKR